MNFLNGNVYTACTEPQFGRGGMYRPVVSTAASGDLRDLLIKSKSDFYDLARQAVNFQLAVWARSETSMKEKTADLSLFDVDFNALKYEGQLGDNPYSDLKTIQAAVTEQARQEIWKWIKFPYSIRNAQGQSPKADMEPQERNKKKLRVEGEEDLVEDADEW